MTHIPDETAVFKRESFAEIARRAREVLREKGFSEDQIDRLLTRAAAEDIADWWAPPPIAKRGNGADPEHQS